MAPMQSRVYFIIIMKLCHERYEKKNFERHLLSDACIYKNIAGLLQTILNSDTNIPFWFAIVLISAKMS